MFFFIVFINMETKKCIECDKPISGQKKMYCSGACKQSHHYYRIKEQTNSYHSQTMRALVRKIKLIEVMGGKCFNCGYNSNLASLEFHHEDPLLKEDRLDARTLSNRSWEHILKEAEKCKLLCSNCHREHHNPDLDINKVKLLLSQQKSYQIDRVKKIVKPKCFDCGCEISYGFKRCTKCNNVFKRKVERPNLKILEEELKANGTTWCSIKYKVSRKTISRWIINKIQ